jgi:hypothetical protein
VLKCESSGCRDFFEFGEVATEPMEDWSKKAAAEAERWWLDCWPYRAGEMSEMCGSQTLARHFGNLQFHIVGLAAQDRSE